MEFVSRFSNTSCNLLSNMVPPLTPVRVWAAQLPAWLCFPFFKLRSQSTSRLWNLQHKSLGVGIASAQFTCAETGPLTSHTIPCTRITDTRDSVQVTTINHSHTPPALKVHCQACLFLNKMPSQLIASNNKSLMQWRLAPCCLMLSLATSFFILGVVGVILRAEFWLLTQEKILAEYSRMTVRCELPHPPCWGAFWVLEKKKIPMIEPLSFFLLNTVWQRKFANGERAAYKIPSLHTGATPSLIWQLSLSFVITTHTSQRFCDVHPNSNSSYLLKGNSQRVEPLLPAVRWKCNSCRWTKVGTPPAPTRN